VEIRKFIRKWGGFNHGDQKLKKFDLDLVVRGEFNNIEFFIYEIEPFFSRVWFNNEDLKNSTLKLNSDEHVFANKLYRFTDEDWESSKRYYNQTDYDSIYLVGEPKEYNVLIELDLTSLDAGSDPLIQNLNNLYSLLEPLEPGVYELGSAKIHIKNLVIISEDHPQVKNPDFDRSLLEIE
jgi:hypothetical protein